MACSKSTISVKNVYLWCKLVQEGEEDANDKPRYGGLRMSKTDKNVEELKNIMLRNHRFNTVLITSASQLTHCHQFFMVVLSMRRVCSNTAKF